MTFSSRSHVLFFKPKQCMLGILFHFYAVYNPYLYVSNFYKVFFNLILLVSFLSLSDIKVGFTFSTNWLCDLF